MDAFFVMVLSLVLLAMGLGALFALRPVLAAAYRPAAQRDVDPADERTVVLPRPGGEDS